MTRREWFLSLLAAGAVSGNLGPAQPPLLVKVPGVGMVKFLNHSDADRTRALLDVLKRINEARFL